MQKGDQRKYGNGIICSVITCTEIKQGVVIETGKTSSKYFNACSIIELHEDDFKTLGINKNTNVRVTSAVGSVILKVKSGCHDPESVSRTCTHPDGTVGKHGCSVLHLLHW